MATSFWGQHTVERILITVGAIILALGLLWPWLSQLGLGRLPGDIVIERDGFTLYVPITTCLLISVVASALIWLIRR